MEIHSDRVTASIQTLFEQATMTANHYLINAIKDIDAQLGCGYSARHPELIAAYMKTAAIDFTGGVISKMLGSIADSNSL